MRETSAPDQIARIKVEEGPHTRGAWSCPICGSPLPTRPADAEAHIGEDIGKVACLWKRILSVAPRNLANDLSSMGGRCLPGTLFRKETAAPNDHQGFCLQDEEPQEGVWDSKEE